MERTFVRDTHIHTLNFPFKLLPFFPIHLLSELAAWKLSALYSFIAFVVGGANPSKAISKLSGHILCNQKLFK